MVIIMANKANSLAHTKWMCKYHIIFTPKYRRKVIYNQYRKDLVVITHEMIFKISRFKIIYFFMHFNSVLVYTIVMKRYVTYPDWVEKFRSPGHTIKKTKQGYAMSLS